MWKINNLNSNEDIRSIATAVTIFTGRNEVLAKVIFLHLSVILFTGGGVCSIFGGVSAPNFQGGCLLQIFGGGRGGSAPNFRGWGSGPGGGSSNFQNTVNIRPVCILLECILVKTIITTRVCR